MPFFKIILFLDLKPIDLIASKFPDNIYTSNPAHLVLNKSPNCLYNFFIVASSPTLIPYGGFMITVPDECSGLKSLISS